jgi:4-hydroxy-tetrahydrodipicolinate synthase
MKGVIAAILTPLKGDGEVDHRRFAGLGKLLLRDGCDGLLPFGTTGEFPSLSVRERLMALDAMIAAGVPADQIIVGTGACALPDMAELSRHAMDHGCAGVLAGPPFYFKTISEDALHATFAALIEAVGAGIHLYLYHFPEMSGIPIPYSVVERLHRGFPCQLAGLKDSAGDFDYSRKLIEDFPALSIFTGDDDLLLANLQAGGAGSITAGANLAVRELASLRDSWRHGDQEAAEAKNQLLRALWSELLLKYPVTEALKEIFAARSASSDWLTMRLPLVQLNNSDREKLLEGFSNLEIDLPPELFNL